MRQGRYQTVPTGRINNRGTGYSVPVPSASARGYGGVSVDLTSPTRKPGRESMLPRPVTSPTRRILDSATRSSIEMECPCCLNEEDEVVPEIAIQASERTGEPTSDQKVANHDDGEATLGTSASQDHMTSVDIIRPVSLNHLGNLDLEPELSSNHGLVDTGPKCYPPDIWADPPNLNSDDVDIPALVDASFLESPGPVSEDGNEDTASDALTPRPAVAPADPNDSRIVSASSTVFFDASGSVPDQVASGETCADISNYDGQHELGSPHLRPSSAPAAPSQRNISSNYSVSGTLVNPSSGPSSPTITQQNHGQVISDVNTIQQQFLGPAVVGTGDFGIETRSELQLLNNGLVDNTGPSGDSTNAGPMNQTSTNKPPGPDSVTVIEIRDHDPQLALPESIAGTLDATLPSQSTLQSTRQPGSLPRMPNYTTRNSRDAGTQAAVVDPEMTPANPRLGTSGRSSKTRVEGQEEQHPPSSVNAMSTEQDPLIAEIPQTAQRGFRAWIRSARSKVVPSVVRQKLFKVDSQGRWRLRRPKFRAPERSLPTGSGTTAPPYGTGILVPL